MPIVYNTLKLAAVLVMIALAILTIRSQRAKEQVAATPPQLVTREVIVTTRPQEMAPVPVAPVERKPVEHKAVVEPRKPEKPVEHKVVAEPHKQKPVAPAKWSLPISCSKVKWYVEHFSQSQLETMRVIAGQPEPTAQQKQQGRDCIEGKYK